MEKILVIDDNLDFQDFVRALLIRDGYEVCSHKDAFGAVRRVQDEKPDLILLDIVLPGATGWNILNQLKSQDQTKHIPVLVCTAAVGDLQKILSGLQLLKVDYITKPFDVEELLQKIAAGLDTFSEA